MTRLFKTAASNSYLCKKTDMQCDQNILQGTPVDINLIILEATDILSLGILRIKKLELEVR
jgi:hypothetical protein